MEAASSSTAAKARAFFASQSEEAEVLLSLFPSFRICNREIENIERYKRRLLLLKESIVNSATAPQAICKDLLRRVYISGLRHVEIYNEALNRISRDRAHSRAHGYNVRQDEESTQSHGSPHILSVNNHIIAQKRSRPRSNLFSKTQQSTATRKVQQENPHATHPQTRIINQSKTAPHPTTKSINNSNGRTIPTNAMSDQSINQA